MRCKPILLAGFALALGSQMPARAAETQTTIVFFSEWSALIDPDATEAVKHAADLAKEGSGRKVTVTGFADTTGSEAANKLLSQLRAQQVADQLVADGVSPDAIKQDAKGETPAPDHSKQASRRVSIEVE